MKRKPFLCLLMFSSVFAGCAESDPQKDLDERQEKPDAEQRDIGRLYYSRAEKAYASEDREKAKELYMKAAEKDFADAHYALRINYDLSNEAREHHLTEAARKGHEKALRRKLENLLFRANSLTEADPDKAFALYKEAKKANPEIEVYSRWNIAELLRMAAEPEGFNAHEFMDKYSIEDHGDSWPRYSVWELAEEASRGGRFGEPDPELVFNLVIRGGLVPFEMKHAIKDTYKNWRNNEVEEFNIGDYVSSGMGTGYVASRRYKEDKKVRQKKLRDLRNSYNDKIASKLNKAYATAVDFFEYKASKEEGHYGTGRTHRVIFSQMRQKNDYLELLREIHEGFIPSPETDNLEEAKDRLYQKYRLSLYHLQNTEPPPASFRPDFNDLRKGHQLWLEYMHSSAELFSMLNPETDKNTWKIWFMEKRKEDYERILDF